MAVLFAKEKALRRGPFLSSTKICLNYWIASICGSGSFSRCPL